LELIRILVPHYFQKLLELLHRLHLPFDLVRLGFEGLKLFLFVIDLFNFLIDPLFFLLGQLLVFLPPYLLLLQEGAELDQVVLDEDVFVPQLLLFLLELLLLPIIMDMIMISDVTSKTLPFHPQTPSGPHTSLSASPGASSQDLHCPTANAMEA